MKPKLLTTLRGYSGRLFLADALAGVTVALVALPLSIAIAIASGADPKAGLVTAIVAGFLISLLGGSKVQIGGLVAALGRKLPLELGRHPALTKLSNTFFSPACSKSISSLLPSWATILP